MSRPEKNHQCNGCCKVGSAKLSCGVCRYTHYCDVNCQRSNWPVHKQMCKEIAVNYPLLKTFPLQYATFYEAVSVIAHIYAQNHNVSSVWVNLDMDENILSAELCNVSMQEIVDEIKTNVDEIKLIEGMVEAYDCLAAYRGVVHLIVSYRNLTCSFRNETQRIQSEETCDKIRKGTMMFVCGNKSKTIAYAIVDDKKERVVLV